MFAKVFVLYAGLAFSVVAANPLLQSIVSQTCPICEQNSLKSQIQNLLLQSIQPYPQTYFNHGPPTQIKQLTPAEQPLPYCPTQNRQNQNQLPPCQKISNQPFCPPQSAQTQSNFVPEAINKLLANPNLKNILDPKTKFFNQNGVEVPKNGPCNSGTPNIVNNYIILPPEFLLEDSVGNQKGRQKIHSERGVKHRVNDSNKIADGNIVNLGPDNNEPGESSPDSRKRKQRRRQKNRNPDIKVKLVAENATQETNQIESPLPLEQAKLHQNKEIPTESSSKQNSVQGSVAETTISRQENNTKSEEEKATIKPNNSKNYTKPKPKSTVSKHFNAREEAVIKDFRHKFPNIPEDVVKNLIKYMKKQLKQQNYNVPPFYYPQFPISYDQLFRNSFSQIPTILMSSQRKLSNSSPHKPSIEHQNLPNNDRGKSTKRRKNRRNQKQQDPSKSTTAVESTSVNVIENFESAKPTTTTTEVPISVVVKEINIETITPKVVEKRKQSENIETNNAIDVKISKANVNEVIDEYYPDFTGDHQYNSDEDYSMIILEDDRFHYTTDKNIELEELNRERRRFQSNTGKNSIHPEGRYILRLKNKDKTRFTSKTTQDKIFSSKISESPSLRSGMNIKTEIPKIVVKIKSQDSIKPTTDANNINYVEWDLEKPKTEPDEKEVKFKTPPKLEKIDFETKQINKKHNIYDEYETKTACYSDIKTPQYNSKKYDEYDKNVDNINQPRPQIETVFANSKVVNYGKPASTEISTEKDIWTDIDKEYSRIENDGRKVIFAKTIDGDFW